MGFSIAKRFSLNTSRKLALDFYIYFSKKQGNQYIAGLFALEKK